MKGYHYLFLSLSLVFFACRETIPTKPASHDEMAWYYDKPASKYWEGLPLATGRFAAMILGKIDEDQIWLNDETLWSGGPYNPNEPQGPQMLGEMRRHLLNKDYAKADSIAPLFGSIPMRVQHYQPMGNLNLIFEGHDTTKITNYHRKLSMDSSLVTISYDLEGVSYKREVFASYPDQVIVMRVSASKPGSVNVSGWMNSLQSSAVSTCEEGDLVLRGGTTDLSHDSYAERVIPGEIKWQTRVRVRNEGGSVSETTISKENGAPGIKVTGADAVTFIIAGATNWKSWNDVSADEKARCNDYIREAAAMDFTGLKKRHIDDYYPLFSACKIDLGSNEAGGLNTSERMELLRQGSEDPLFAAQYFQYGRYLMLAGARENTLAFNNHNIWLNNMEGRWQGRWTLNINIQECYWPVENTNLPRINESLVYFTEQLAQAGERTAKEMYNCRGWVAHHGTDVWFNTAPTDGHTHASIWTGAGPWLLQQLYDHYEYEPDADDLKRIYPLMKGSAQFLLDFMITDPESGYLVTCPSTTPENYFVTEDQRRGLSIATAMDIQLIRNLFRNTIHACEVLNVDPDLRKQMEDATGKLPPHQIGKHGQLQEWFYDYEELDVHHRHLSHLFAFYPDDDITIHKTPELAKAVERALERKGDIRLGWSGAWKINLFARMQKPEEAYNILQKMLVDVSLHPRDEDSRITPSFEGNQGIQGVTAGIAEMLMQSHSGEISLLPALPGAWPAGSVTGLRARGGYDVDLEWENGKLKRSVITAKFSGPCRIRSKEAVKIASQDVAVNADPVGENVVSFVTEAGRSYEIMPAD